MGSIRCSEICIAGSDIFYSHVQHFKMSEQPTITITRLFLVTLQSAVRREIKFHVTVHITCSSIPKSQPLNQSLYTRKLPPLYLVRFNVISYRLLGSDAVPTKLHSITYIAEDNLIRLLRTSALNYGLYI
jgi:hypothetical protein